MRKSHYTIEAAGPSGEHLLYNTANGAFAELDEAAWSAWTAKSLEGALAGELEELGLLTALSASDELSARGSCSTATAPTRRT